MRASAELFRTPRACAVAATRAMTLAQMTSTSVLVVVALIAVLLFGTLAVTLGGSDAAAAAPTTPTTSQAMWAGE